jgi:hypothetical protein
VIAVNEGFAWGLSCTNENGEPVSSLVVANLTPGQDPAGNGGDDDSHIDGGLQFMDEEGHTIRDQANSFDILIQFVAAGGFAGVPAAADQLDSGYLFTGEYPCVLGWLGADLRDGRRRHDPGWIRGRAQQPPHWRVRKRSDLRRQPEPAGPIVGTAL